MTMLDMINNSNSETLILNLREALGMLDLKSLGYYNVTHRRFSCSRASTAKYLSTLAVPHGYYTLDT